MAVTSSQALAISASAVALNAAETDTVAGTKVTVKNTHATVVVALGDSAVTASTGFQLATGATLTVELAGGERLYAIRVGAADGTVDVLRTGA